MYKGIRKPSEISYRYESYLYRWQIYTYPLHANFNTCKLIYTLFSYVPVYVSIHSKTPEVYCSCCCWQQLVVSEMTAIVWQCFHCQICQFCRLTAIFQLDSFAFLGPKVVSISLCGNFINSDMEIKIKIFAYGKQCRFSLYWTQNIPINQP